MIWLLSVEKGGVASLECAADLSRHSRPVNCVRFSPSGEFLASGDDDSSIIVWKMKTSSDPVEFPSGEEENFKEQWISVKVLRGHLQDVYDLSWSPDSKNLISGSVDNSAILWEVSSGKNLGILGDHKGFVQGVAWDPCGQYVATMSSDSITRCVQVGLNNLARTALVLFLNANDHVFVCFSARSQFCALEHPYKQLFRPFVHPGNTMRPTSLQLQQFNKPPKTTYQVLLGKLTTPVQATKDGIPLSCYCRAIKEQVLSSLLLLITPSTERILTERILLKDADSVKMLPQVTMPRNETNDLRRH
ncbi:Chromatin assembly factor 1 subunit B [Homalodisca vitripennis]|nr:Chromatin assembly factor 1 subunit B [Homalodisca vitripennis]